MDFSGAQTLMGTLKNTDRILACRNDSGIEDRFIGMRSFDQIRSARPDASLAEINAPHLVLQQRPREPAEQVSA